MSGILKLLTTFDGRIGRQRFWLGAVCIIVVSSIVAALAVWAGLSDVHTVTGTVTLSTGETQQFSNTNVTLWPWAAFVLSVFTAIPMTAIGVKRRHDRDGSGVDVIAYAGFTTFVQFLYALGTPSDWFATALALVTLVWGICLFVLLGFLRGTSGPNKYGPDTIAAVVPAA